MDEHFRQMGLRYEEISAALSQKDVARDQARFQALMKDLALLQPQLNTWQALVALRQEEATTRALLDQPEMRELAEEELPGLMERIGQLQEELQLMMLPRDADDERNVIMEIRAGAGGDEAALFSALLLRMYSRFAERSGFKASLLSLSESELGGVREAVLEIRGQGAFSLLKYESGVHRVQRVPATESQGRIHTSTATVAVLPEWDDVQVEIAPGDLRVDVFRSGGHGGQSVNTTDSAVRITHLPTGIVATCQNEKSQIKNREQALKVLKLRLHEKALKEKEEAYAENRREQVGSGDRSERIRTYNFPQGRVSDHRIGLTLFQIEQVMDGDLQPFIDALALHTQKRQMEETKV